MVGKAFGAAGANVVIQEFLEGIEVSLHALCDGKTAKIFPTSQDHKRALDGDLGLNTGGMGTYSPTPFLTDAQLADVARAEFLNRSCAAARRKALIIAACFIPASCSRKTGRKFWNSTRASAIRKRKFI